MIIPTFTTKWTSNVICNFCLDKNFPKDYVMHINIEEYSVQFQIE